MRMAYLPYFEHSSSPPPNIGNTEPFFISDHEKGKYVRHYDMTWLYFFIFPHHNLCWGRVPLMQIMNITDDVMSNILSFTFYFR